LNFARNAHALPLRNSAPKLRNNYDLQFVPYKIIIFARKKTAFSRIFTLVSLLQFPYLPSHDVGELKQVGLVSSAISSARLRRFSNLGYVR